MRFSNILGGFIALVIAVNSAGCGMRPAVSLILSHWLGHQKKPQKDYQDLIIGYAQIGAESEWRTANTTSLKETAEQLNVEFRFSDAQQKQENQILALRKFIAQKVDLIGISPVVETGWEPIFREAKDAGIPIILVDRYADVPDDLYITYLGSDFVEEGRNSARVMEKLINGKGNIVEIVGTIGSAPANGRAKGFREMLKNYPGMVIIDSASGDFTRARGMEAMKDFLKKYGNTIRRRLFSTTMICLSVQSRPSRKPVSGPVWISRLCQSMLRGARFEAMIAGKLNATIECNPLLGPQFFDLVLKVVNGESVPKRVPSIESIYYPDNAAEILPTRKY